MPDSDAEMTLGRKIAKARKSAGLTQPDLAKACGWLLDDGSPAQARVSNYETGTRVPGMDELHQIAEATGAEIGFFYAKGDPAAGAQERANLVREARAHFRAGVPIEEKLKIIEEFSEDMSREDAMRVIALLAEKSLKKRS